MMNCAVGTDELAVLRERTRVLAELAFAEDVGCGDITAGLVEAQGSGAFVLVARQAGVFCGREVAPIVLDVFGGGIELEWCECGCDGARMSQPPVTVATLRGRVQQILTVERTLLNFLQRLSGIATKARAFVDAVAGTGAEILDTRKTTPGWRVLEKYAVRCGGGRNHRMGLYDAVLIKDNHLAGCPPARTAARVHELLNRLTDVDPRPRFIEVEADHLIQVEQLLDVVGVDVILLDNFSLDDMRRAVELRDARNLRGKVRLEASGGVTLESVRAIAETGVDCISVGGLTHSAVALDLALDHR